MTKVKCDNSLSSHYRNKYISTNNKLPGPYGCDKEEFFTVENAKDRFMKLLESSNSITFESIITEYIHNYGTSIPADECCQIIELLSAILYPKITRLNAIKRTAKERATYLKSYLDGTMYNNDDETFIKYRDIQKNNVQAIIDECDEI